MYYINDRAGAIYNVQRFLYFLSKNDYNVPIVYPDGIYGLETRSAVRAFQALQGISESGIVNYDTFTRLVNEYRKALRAAAPPERVRIFPRLLLNRSILPGEESSLVSILQAMLLTIGIAYDELLELKINGIYDKATENIVNKIKLASGMEPDSVIDKDTFAMIAKLYESFVNDDM